MIRKFFILWAALLSLLIAAQASAHTDKTLNSMPPGSPTITAVTVTGPTTVTIAFTAPTSYGGAAITQYTATAIKTATPTSGAITGTVYQATGGTITLSGLTAGSTNYSFTVAAINSFGTGLSVPYIPSIKR